ncbi:MAG TPA: helix-turn-helix domain-containing protein [Alphaproteobacteria bacterium]|jgi:DNA-binding HxlR family transcriptional regulator|nr:helix-turn-helix domain-containing protein [Alphaproteobacteria bacterium]
MGTKMSGHEYGCGLEAALEVVGGKWKVLILWALGSGPRRFGELRREIPGISEKMLIQHLKEMQGDGIVRRKDYGEVPPRVDYAMTPFGHSLCEALAPLCAWGEQHMKRIAARQRDNEARRQKATA